MVCTGCCATLDHIVTYLFKLLTQKGNFLKYFTQLRFLFAYFVLAFWYLNIFALILLYLFFCFVYMFEELSHTGHPGYSPLFSLESKFLQFVWQPRTTLTHSISISLSYSLLHLYPCSTSYRLSSCKRKL